MWGRRRLLTPQDPVEHSSDVALLHLLAEGIDGRRATVPTVLRSLGFLI